MRYVINSDNILYHDNIKYTTSCYYAIMPSSLCFFFVVHLALGCPGAPLMISQPRPGDLQGLWGISSQLPGGTGFGQPWCPSRCARWTRWRCYKLLQVVTCLTRCYNFLQDVTSCLPILPWYIFTFSDEDASISCTNNCQGVLEAWCVGSEGHLHPYSKVPLRDCSKSCFEVVSLLQPTCGSNKTELHAN